MIELARLTGGPRDGEVVWHYGGGHFVPNAESTGLYMWNGAYFGGSGYRVRIFEWEETGSE